LIDSLLSVGGPLFA